MFWLAHHQNLSDCQHCDQGKAAALPCQIGDSSKFRLNAPFPNRALCREQSGTADAVREFLPTKDRDTFLRRAFLISVSGAAIRKVAVRASQQVFREPAACRFWTRQIYSRAGRLPHVPPPDNPPSQRADGRVGKSGAIADDACIRASRRAKPFAPATPRARAPPTPGRPDISDVASTSAWGILGHSDLEVAAEVDPKLMPKL